MIDPHGLRGGPVISNPADYEPVLSWTTYPERLEAAGVSWQVYANDEVGDDGSHPFCGDYGDNPLWLFKAYHDALASADPNKKRLAQRGGLHNGWKPDSGKGKDTSHVLAQFIADCSSGQLPSVSWVVAPYGYSEHPAARPVDGAAYVQRVLQAIWGNAKLQTRPCSSSITTRTTDFSITSSRRWRHRVPLTNMCSGCRSGSAPAFR